MKLNVALGLILCTCLLHACSSGDKKIQSIASQDGFAVLPQPKSSEAVATFAGGCFWAMQESLIQLKGVNTVISGYAGGTTVNPSYEEVLQKQTGHAEAVQVYYDPSSITYEQLLQAFFFAHDPTELNRQGPDIGSDYRSIAFYRTPEELKTISKVIAQMEAKKIYPNAFVTEEDALIAFYPAESSHQNYYQRNTWDPYIRSVSKPKVLNVQQHMAQLIKKEYLK
jgi:peptide-methionine (S)-S-oxide reductase